MTKPKNARPYPRYSLKFKKPSLTKQSFKNECDINKILSNYLKTGELTHLNEQKPNYGFAPSEDFQASVIVVEDAKRAFSALPSKIRSQFGNDPAFFLDFTQDPANLPEMAEMGLLSPEATLKYNTAPDDLSGLPKDENPNPNSDPLPGDPE